MSQSTPKPTPSKSFGAIGTVDELFPHAPWTPYELRKIFTTLLRPFLPGEVKRRQQGKKKNDLTGQWEDNYVEYVEGNSVIDRLNEAVTPLGWSFAIEDDQIYYFHPEHPADPGWPSEVEVHGKLTIHTPWGQVSREGYGSNEVKYKDQKRFNTQTNRQEPTGLREVMGIAEDRKGAATDALKKCATQFGIYNYGYRKHQQPEPAKEVREVIEQLKDLAASKPMTTLQLMEFCSGVTRKTILGPGDLTLSQAQLCLLLLTSYQPGVF